VTIASAAPDATGRSRISPSFAKGAQTQIDGTGLKPLAYGHPVNSPPSCDPPQHPKRDAALGSRPAQCAAARGGAPSTRPKRRIFGRSGAAKRPHFLNGFRPLRAAPDTARKGRLSSWFVRLCVKSGRFVTSGLEGGLARYSYPRAQAQWISEASEVSCQPHLNPLSNSYRFRPSVEGAKSPLRSPPSAGLSVRFFRIIQGDTTTLQSRDIAISQYSSNTIL
jgi:hypothetical protein